MGRFSDFLAKMKDTARSMDDDSFFGSDADSVEPETAQPQKLGSFFADADVEEAPVSEQSAPRKGAFRIPKRELRRRADELDAEEDRQKLSGRAAPAKAKTRMSMASPKKFVEGAALANELLAGNTILLNLDQAPKVDARRLLDFMSGAAYVMQGYVKRVSGNVYLVVPNGEDVSENDALSQIENSGVFL